MPWYPLRDLKRPNAKDPAYKMLESQGFEIFTPMTTRLTTYQGKKQKITVPVIPDLLFAHAEKSDLDPIILRTSTLQYRYAPGQNFDSPMTVRDQDMEQFIKAVNAAGTEAVKYLTPAELTRHHIGATIRITDGGPLDGLEGRLLSIRGSKKRRLLIELPALLTAAIEISPAYLQLLP